MFEGMRLMLVINKVVSKWWEICWDLWSLVVFAIDYDPTRYKTARLFRD